jgi:hypothetical protein
MAVGVGGAVSVPHLPAIPHEPDLHCEPNAIAPGTLGEFGMFAPVICVKHARASWRQRGSVERCLFEFGHPPAVAIKS